MTNAEKSGIIRSSMKTDLRTQVQELHESGYSPRVIATTLGVPEGLVHTVITLLGNPEVPRKSYEAALREMGLSESYIEHALRDERKRATGTKQERGCLTKYGDDIPVFDRGPWREYLNSERASGSPENRRRYLREGFDY